MFYTQKKDANCLSQKPSLVSRFVQYEITVIETTDVHKKSIEWRDECHGHLLAMVSSTTKCVAVAYTIAILILDGFDSIMNYLTPGRRPASDYTV